MDKEEIRKQYIMVLDDAFEDKSYMATKPQMNEEDALFEQVLEQTWGFIEKQLSKTIPIKEVLRLIRNHYEKDESAFSATLLALVGRLRDGGNDESALYILAQAGQTNTFTTSSGEQPTKNSGAGSEGVE